MKTFNHSGLTRLCTADSDVIDHSELLRMLDYCEMTGLFTWKISLSNRAPVGSVAGKAAPGCYGEIAINGQRYKAHKLAIYWYSGIFPFEDVDHRDGNKSNNRVDNLRAIGVVGNTQNILGPRSNNKSGFLGVFRCKDTGRWKASIHADGRRHCLGRHDTPEQAHAAYLKAKRELHAGNTL